jgi:putative oxidoreductase
MEFKGVAKSGDLLIRAVTGLIFILAGYGKLFAQPGIEGFSGMLSGIGFPAPVFFAVLVGGIELVGGILLLIGFWTHISSLFLAVIMLTAIFTVHLQNGWADVRYPLLVLVALVRYIGTPGTFASLARLRATKVPA